jgi:hypothetical protein
MRVSCGLFVCRTAPAARCGLMADAWTVASLTPNHEGEAEDESAYLRPSSPVSLLYPPHGQAGACARLTAWIGPLASERRGPPQTQGGAGEENLNEGFGRPFRWIETG